MNRRKFFKSAVASSAALAFPSAPRAAVAEADTIVDEDSRFPYFQSTPVPYFNVQLRDSFWAPRQKKIHDVTLPWATRHWDEAGGIEEFKMHPNDYSAKVREGDLEAIKFLEALASVDGLKRDAAIEGLIDAWAKEMMENQGSDGYFHFGWPLGSDPKWRWKAVWWSHEDYALGHYLESAIAYREASGHVAMYASAVRGVDNMASVLLRNERSYAPGHEEIEQALMRLYGITGNRKYLRLCGWLIGQRGHHEGRPSYGKYSQDDVPVNEQRTIEGHAVRAAFLYNGVTQYVGATGDEGYREAVLSVWDDFANHKMYLHGGGGNASANNEGYSPRPDFIPPGDAYCESCSVVGNFQWAHNLFRLTGDARYLDVAERMLYNAFYASLSLSGDRFFYRNVAQRDEPVERFEWGGCPCCPPNIVKLFSKVGGFFYAVDKDGIFINHYGAAEADIPFRGGLKLIQRTAYPWEGQISLHLQPLTSTDFTLRLRIPAWAASHTISVNGEAIPGAVDRGWAAIRRFWKAGDQVELNLPMTIERVTMPNRFKEYENLAALQRGPIVYCIEQQDSTVTVPNLYFPEDAKFTAEHRPELLGGITVLKGILPQAYRWQTSASRIPVTFIPYGVWNNRKPDPMWIWLQARQTTDFPSHPPGEG